MSTILFSPLQLRKVILRNRLVVSPMCQYSAEDGFANDWHLVHYGSRAVGGAGLILQEATAVAPEGRISPDDLGIWKEEHVQPLRRITDFISAQGAVPGIQLAHSGRKGSTSSEWKGGGSVVGMHEGGWQTIAPSAVPFRDSDPLPEELSIEGIHRVINDFVKATQRSLAAGYKVVEIHAAHGYLLHQFLSPLSNHRTDSYGGSFENRIRLLLEIVDAVRAVWPQEYPLFVRISATDWAENGWNMEDSVKLSALLKHHGVDLMDISSGGLIPTAKVPVAFGYQVGFATRIKSQTEMPTGAVGLLVDPVQMETLLVNKNADLLIVGREWLRNPYLGLEAASMLHADMPWPVQYQRAKPNK
ncbi:NADH:flavin oxidoreductase/NADH oxidase [Microbacter margulisiae]|uniref:2,4-dienoyl-CoA reductase-like NADH-dependent reductase (Old Yellow Enzyme family) n=1 Tax=Microbacter margulisiae TaxID=1350067 RepID=A0A7W5DPY0_9PORP|nr:NADH:flavin oxidoreductase/NADH oxidase [Microbacter margulisiae]MBB3186914.1 2,4-dienoyl-CoA reductase-like NADH-dependent reductase (Old Yellow Enzyme family) [Microbacter margulisiae]